MPASDPTPVQIALGFALALGVGGAVGLERERHAFTERKPSFGGARTFPLVALLGALAAFLSRALGPAVLVGAFVALTILLAVGFLSTRREFEEAKLGLTTELSALVVFAIGALPFADSGLLDFPARLLLGGALGAVVMSLLAMRQPIHRFAENLSYEDLLATVRFALLAVVALPLLPDRSFGLDALNPFRIGVVVVLIAGISFVGYVAVRLYGARKGIGVTALAGGLASSTAVALNFSARGKEHPPLARACALAIALAATIMFLRVLVEIAAIRFELLLPAAAPIGTMLVVSTIGCLVLWRRIPHASETDDAPGFRNPFRLGQALRLGLVYAVIRVVADAAWKQFGSGGLLLSAGVSGLADVDAITISVARMHGGGLPDGEAVAAITIASTANTLVKVGIAAVLGGGKIGLWTGLVLVPAAAAGTAVAFLV